MQSYEIGERLLREHRANFILNFGKVSFESSLQDLLNFGIKMHSFSIMFQVFFYHLLAQSYVLMLVLNYAVQILGIYLIEVVLESPHFKFACSHL